ncbi:MAG: hypothetical protein UY52_C0001G0030 [Parcubacteria group bacterium GW2011_GWC2_49_9]|nr:MAG: hypothetical protein UY34_C0003G0023 [Parcubacteria group bacterium GW2011_GWA2_48_9]KKW16710.1 MAG: hypothetical protein UY52_C0001G0030 [Parcubacteria group bacterium GW2011_GWC2_49_9]
MENTAVIIAYGALYYVSLVLIIILHGWTLFGVRRRCKYNVFLVH